MLGVLLIIVALQITPMVCSCKQQSSLFHSFLCVRNMEQLSWVALAWSVMRLQLRCQLGLQSSEALAEARGSTSKVTNVAAGRRPPFPETKRSKSK